ncbi:hypothetical protein ACFYZ2_16430 [Streptomyces sviceus]|uniref:hypothetical protein n=1 Tax=Streptomyces sviceus TaxID=285530 RepID=UPI0036CDA308
MSVRYAALGTYTVWSWTGDGRGGLQAVGRGEHGGVGAVRADQVDLVVVTGGEEGVDVAGEREVVDGRHAGGADLDGAGRAMEGEGDTQDGALVSCASS